MIYDTSLGHNNVLIIDITSLTDYDFIIITYP